jgi:hypothetical protein
MFKDPDADDFEEEDYLEYYEDDSDEPDTGESGIAGRPVRSGESTLSKPAKQETPFKVIPKKNPLPAESSAYADNTSQEFVEDR